LIDETDPVPARFEDLGLGEASLAVLRKIGFREPSPIQAAFIPVAMTGRDCIGQARTGTGKTASFVLPILERLDFDDARTQSLVLTPTRELSQQVSDEAVRLSSNHAVTTACCVGGRPLKTQMNELKRGAQIVIGTPGRVIDLMERGCLVLDHLKIVVLDEADRMLDIGFRPDIERILKRCHSDRQTLLLSATLPPPVERLAQRYMRSPERIDMSIDTVRSDTIDQYYIAVDHDRKFPVLVRLLVQERPQQAIVFTRTKRGAEDVFRRFRGRLEQTAFIHGDLAQSARDRVMREFRDGSIRLLIATDVMGRGIDVSGISHIINYDIPQDCDDYVHRIGRTGRLSSNEMKGSAFTFVAGDEGDLLTIAAVPNERTSVNFHRLRPKSNQSTKTISGRNSKPIEQPPEKSATRFELAWQRSTRRLSSRPLKQGVFQGRSSPSRRGDRVADRAGLEIQCGVTPTEGSNPSLSAATCSPKLSQDDFGLCCLHRMKRNEFLQAARVANYSHGIDGLNSQSSSRKNIPSTPLICSMGETMGTGDK
jgi:ATP-dependent RNA helicase DeaD